MGKLRVCVLQCFNDDVCGAVGEVDPNKQPELYDKEGEFEWTTVFIRKATSAAQLVALAGSGRFDVYLNLCDGAWDEGRAGRDVVEALERLNLPYTGADLAFYEPSKVEMKMATQYYDVQVPAWVHIRPRGPEGLEEDLAAVLAPPESGGLGFPLLVKHPSGYSSVGITRASKVHSEEQLREQVVLLLKMFGGALVEEFVEGREFTVLVVEEPVPEEQQQQRQQQQQQDAGSQAERRSDAAPTAACASAKASACANAALSLDPDLCSFQPVACMPVECVFAPGEDFKHFDLKWHDYDSCNWRVVDDAELVERLKEAACNTFVATRGVSYGRCDFRVDAAGEVYLLEINPNCGVLYPPGQHGSADFVLSLDPAHDHMRFIRTIIASALERHRLKQPKIAPAYFRRPRAAQALAQQAPALVASPTAAVPAPAAVATSRAACGDWGLVAQTAIRAGEVVQRNEQRPKTLASLGFVRRHWPEGSRHRQWFDAYAYPVSEEVWITWASDPAAWAPMNHSCDPNTWLVGLDAVARRDIRPGEHVTIDYATFNVDNMAPFDCTCGAACCRGRITGQDHLAAWLTERYGSHITPFIAEKRRRAGLPV